MSKFNTLLTICGAFAPHMLDNLDSLLNNEWCEFPDHEYQETDKGLQCSKCGYILVSMPQERKVEL